VVCHEGVWYRNSYRFRDSRRLRVAEWHKCTHRTIIIFILQFTGCQFVTWLVSISCIESYKVCLPSQIIIEITGNNNMVTSLSFTSQHIRYTVKADRLWKNKIKLESLNVYKEYYVLTSVTLLQSSWNETSRMRPQVFSNVSVRPSTSICRVPSTISRHNIHQWHCLQSVRNVTLILLWCQLSETNKQGSVLHTKLTTLLQAHGEQGNIPPVARLTRSS